MSGFFDSAFIFFYVTAEAAESIFGPSNGNRTSFCKILIVQYFDRYLSYYYFGSSDKGQSSAYNGLGNLKRGIFKYIYTSSRYNNNN